MRPRRRGRRRGFQSAVARDAAFLVPRAGDGLGRLLPVRAVDRARICSGVGLRIDADLYLGYNAVILAGAVLTYPCVVCLDPVGDVDSALVDPCVGSFTALCAAARCELDRQVRDLRLDIGCTVHGLARTVVGFYLRSAAVCTALDSRLAPLGFTLGAC